MTRAEDRAAEYRHTAEELRSLSEEELPGSRHERIFLHLARVFDAFADDDEEPSVGNSLAIQTAADAAAYAIRGGV